MPESDLEQIAQFYRATINVTDAPGLMDAAKGTFDHPEEYVAIIRTVAESKNISVAEELFELQKMSALGQAQARQKKVLEEAQATGAEVINIAQQYVQNLTEGHVPDEPEMREAAALLEKKAIGLKLSIPEHRKRMLESYKDYLEEMQNFRLQKPSSTARCLTTASMNS